MQTSFPSNLLNNTMINIENSYFHDKSSSEYKTLIDSEKDNNCQQ